MSDEQKAVGQETVVVQPVAPEVVSPVEAVPPAAGEVAAAPAPAPIQEAAPAVQAAEPSAGGIAAESQSAGAGVAAVAPAAAVPAEKPKKVYQAPIGVSVNARTVVVDGELREMAAADQIQLPWMDQS